MLDADRPSGAAGSRTHGSVWPQSLLNGSEMGRRILELDWARTPLGPIDTWPQTLRVHVGMMVDNKFPMYIFWGPRHVALYNDGYIEVAGGKHPRMLGMPTQQIWDEVWPVIAPLLEQVRDGEAFTFSDLLLTLQRNGFDEDAYFTFCYSPLRGDGGTIDGVLATLFETTERVLAERRLELLRSLASRSSGVQSEADVLATICDALDDTPDVPFASVYLAAEGSSEARLVARAGTMPAGVAVPDAIDLALFAPLGPGVPERDELILTPIAAPDQHAYIGALVAGTNPRLQMDGAYREFMALLAAQIGSSVVAARALKEERLRTESLQVTRTIQKIGLFAESGQQLFWMTKPDGWIDWYHQSWYDYTGQTSEEALGWGWTAVHHPADLQASSERWNESLSSGAPFEMTFRLRGKDGRYRWFLTRAVPELDDDGRVLRWYGTSTNIDSERMAARQLNVLARLGERLVQTLDREGALNALADCLIPDVADWTMINLAEPDGSLLLAAARHRDPERSALLQSFIGTSYERTGSESVGVRVFRTGRPEVFDVMTPVSARTRVTTAFADAVEALGLTSAIVVPIVSAGRVVGTFHAISSGSEIGYAASDVPFFEEVGRRIGFALQNAGAYEREARIAHAFQNAAMPTALPEVAGLCFASLYQPASSDANVGGDFYDAFRLLDGRVVVSIGDVSGSGLSAAATMAALRQSIRAAASINPDPDLVLKAADGVFSDPGRPAFASAFVAVIDPLTFSIRYANAGHPPALLRAPDGSLTRLGGSDLLLGIDTGDHHDGRQVVQAAIAPGSLLVLYTDGLTEATGDIARGEELLDRAVSAPMPSATTAPTIPRSLYDAVLGAGGRSKDDVALLTVYFEEKLSPTVSPRLREWSFIAQDAASAYHVRNEIVRELEAAGFRADDVFAAEMIFSELVGNAVRYAGPALDVALDLTQDAPVLHVIDSGAGFSLNPKLPLDSYAERGRGLYIVTRLARELTITARTTANGSHARVVLFGHYKPA